MLRFRRVVAVLIALGATQLTPGCGGRSTLKDVVDNAGGSGGAAFTPCGDGVCDPDASETCSTCPLDCDLCATCPNKVCDEDSGETCSSCPQDCGVCEACGDGYCKDGEDCLSCAPDCDKCPACGDKQCDPGTETCFTCPDDCGKCKTCGDGLCEADKETCSSCPNDCGVCAVCGNGKCQAYETCSNCHADCGDCKTIGCIEIVKCALQGCIDQSTKPTKFSLSCVANCVSVGCSDVQYFVDQVVECAVTKFDGCGSDFDCIQKACDAQFGACLGARCPSTP